MQIPEHWAEARLVGEVNGNERVVRRWGWSDTSAGAALAHAEQRATAAMAELRAGRTVAPREKKLAYGNAGLPIREEIVARSGDDVITRNSYGARCLNVPDVLFADVDVRIPRVLGRVYRILAWTLALMTVPAAVGLLIEGSSIARFATVITALLAPAVMLAHTEKLRRRPEHVEATRRLRRAVVHRFVRQHPDVRFAIYETPAGLRVLALHATYDPAGTAARELFAAIETDRAYVRMCELQACFRARLSPKPWRIGVPNIVTRSVWPVPADRAAARAQWVADYETAARGHAACRFVEEIGSGQLHPRCAAVQRMHDEACRARTGLPIA